jgi:hypothetical protein
MEGLGILGLDDDGNPIYFDFDDDGNTIYFESDSDDSDVESINGHKTSQQTIPRRLSSGDSDSTRGKSSNGEDQICALVPTNKPKQKARKKGQHPGALPGPVARCSRCTEITFCCTCT